MTIYELDPRAETQRQLQALVEALTQQNDALQARLADAQRLHVAAEQINSDLVKLCVVHERLHESTTLPALYAALDEIVSAVVGCEEFALIARDADGGPRLLHAGPLLAAADFASLPCAQMEILRCLSGDADIQVEAPAPADGAPRPTAIVPLRHDGVTVAVLVLYRVLPQKLDLEPLDHAVIELLSRHAGSTMRAASRFQAAGTPA